MERKNQQMLSLFGVSLLILILFGLRFFDASMILASVLLIVSIYLVVKVHTDIYLLFIAIPILYSNYSIAIGEFIFKNSQITFNQLRFSNYNLYLDLLLMLTIFTSIFAANISPIIKQSKLIFKRNDLFFYFLVFIALIINIFFFDRSVSEGYMLRSNSLHGYLFIVFIFMIFYSGNKRSHIIITVITAMITVIQSLVYGGRQSVIPVAIVVLLMLFIEKLKAKYIILIALGGIILLTLVGQMRGAEIVHPLEVVKSLFEGMLVQDTTIYAFNSSVTHLFASSYYSVHDRLISFVGFVSSWFIGEGTSFTNLGNVTRIADDVANNLGGGIIVSHFYFWIGWFGVVVSPIIISQLINILRKGKNEVFVLILIALASTASTWYIYSPLQFFRIITILIPLPYILLKFVHKEMINIK